LTSAPDDPNLDKVWRLMVHTEKLRDGNWRAWYPGLAWSVTAAAEDDAEAKAVQEAIGRCENPDKVARKVAATDRRPIELEPDDPRTKGLWRFIPQTEQRSDGTWRAWYASGGWSVTGATEAEAKDKALRESARRRSDPDEIARRVAIMRRHLIEPVPGVSMFDKSVLQSVWQSHNPTQEVGRILDQLGEEPPCDR
jgi:hypothetical protein